MEEEKYINRILADYPRLDRLMAKTIYDCYKAGTLDKIIEERKELGEFVHTPVEEVVLKNVTIE